LIVAISLDASADKPIVSSPGKSGVKVVGVTPAKAVSNWLDAASASSGVPPAAITSLNALNALLLVLAAFIVVLKADAAFDIALGSLELAAFTKRKAAAATLASLLPVKEDAASNTPAVSPRLYASTALNICSPVLTSVGMLELIPVALIAEFIKPGTLPVLIAFAPVARFFAVPMSKPPTFVTPNPSAAPNPVVNAPSTSP
jgi:hypothetical protein